MKNLELKALTNKELIKINGGGSGDNFWYDVGYVVGVSVVVEANVILETALQVKKLLK